MVILQEAQAEKSENDMKNICKINIFHILGIFSSGKNPKNLDFQQLTGTNTDILKYYLNN